MSGTPSTCGVEQVRQVGLRVTKQRLAVLHTLQCRPHADAARVVESARDQIGAVSTQAVYDVLAALTEAGLARRIEPAGLSWLYELRTGDNHHHLICRGCGAVVDIDCALGARPCLTPSTNHGFLVDEAEVIYWGRCPSCTVAGPRH
ncbi:MAG: transcriptional repressor [Actinobacteria bacterium]|nr:transcriptional repressor [Actinomycetota bacterium]